MAKVFGMSPETVTFKSQIPPQLCNNTKLIRWTSTRPCNIKKVIEVEAVDQQEYEEGSDHRNFPIS